MELQDHLEELRDANIEPIGVSYDSIDVLKRFTQKEKIEYPLLSDPKAEVIRKYKLKNPNPPRPQMDGIPHPATLIVGQDGAIRAILAHDGYQERHTSQEIIAAGTKD